MHLRLIGASVCLIFFLSWTAEGFEENKEDVETESEVETKSKNVKKQGKGRKEEAKDGGMFDRMNDDRRGSRGGLGGSRFGRRKENEDGDKGAKNAGDLFKGKMKGGGEFGQVIGELLKAKGKGKENNENKGEGGGLKELLSGLLSEGGGLGSFFDDLKGGKGEGLEGVLSGLFSKGGKKSGLGSFFDGLKGEGGLSSIISSIFSGSGMESLLGKFGGEKEIKKMASSMNCSDSCVNNIWGMLKKNGLMQCKKSKQKSSQKSSNTMFENVD